jgi:hypothetical protein
MNNIANFISLVFVHFIMDWLFQTNYQALNKSKHFNVLLTHSTIYTLGFIFPFLLFHINLL